LELFPIGIRSPPSIYMRGSWPIEYPSTNRTIKLPIPFTLIFSQPLYLLFGSSLDEICRRSKAALLVLGDPSRVSSRQIFPEGVLRLIRPRFELHIGPSDLLIVLAGHAAILATVAGRQRPLGRLKPTGVVIRTSFGVNSHALRIQGFIVI